MHRHLFRLELSIESISFRIFDGMLTINRQSFSMNSYATIYFTENRSHVENGFTHAFALTLLIHRGQKGESVKGKIKSKPLSNHLIQSSELILRHISSPSIPSKRMLVFKYSWNSFSIKPNVTHYTHIICCLFFFFIFNWIYSIFHIGHIRSELN